MPRVLECCASGDPRLPLAPPPAGASLAGAAARALGAAASQAGVSGAGGALRLAWHNRAACSEGMCCVKVAAAGLNFADALLVQGLYQERPAHPFVPGGELSGVVTEVGAGVRGLAVGDEVIAVAPGAFAEEVCCRAEQTIKLPRLPSGGGKRQLQAASASALEAAAGLPIAFGTAHLALTHRAQLRAGQTVLVLGAGGGVGQAAVQLARLQGAFVVAVARGKRKVGLLKKLGADVVIDSSSLGEDGKGLRAAVSAALPAGKSINVLFDTVGGVQHAEGMRTLAWGGQVLIIGFASGPIPKIASNIALVKNLTVHGVYWGSYFKHRPEVVTQSLHELVAMLGDGRLTVPVSHAFSLEEAPKAFSALLGRQSAGKVLLVPGKRRARL